MKKLFITCLPALTLLVLSGCAGTSALTSSEDDGVYYSSKDRTTAVARQAPAPASTSEAANPDYNGNTGGTAQSNARSGSGSTQYYDNTYTYMRGASGYGGSSYYGPGLSYYSPYSPYTTLSYAPPISVCYGYGYGWGGGACGYSPYAYGGYDPYYSPYSYGYSPYYGYGSGFSISFGRPYGYGYSPYGYGYSPYYYGGSYYGGYYGRNSYYGNNYYGNSYSGAGYSDRRPASNYHRAERGSDGRYATGGGSVSGGTPTPVGPGRVRSERAMPADEQRGQLVLSELEGGRQRRNDVGSGNLTQSGNGYNQPRRLEETERTRTSDVAPVRQPDNTVPGQITRDDRGRWRDGNSQPTRDQPQPEGGRQREATLQGGFSSPESVSQPRQQSYEQPQRTRERSYEQPQRSYEQPQRSYSQPSYSAPSYGGGNSGGGGGNSGGGGGGGGGRRSRD